MDYTVESPARLDAFLSDQLEDLSRGQVQKLIKDGQVEVNGNIVAKPAHQLKEEDTVVCHGSTSLTMTNQVAQISPVDLKLEILYEDDSCLVINKPAGYAVHPASGMPEHEVTILSGIAHLFEQQNISFSQDAALVHRLDKETTGCLLIAKNAEAHHQLQKQFEDRTVQKKYLALVAGVPNPPAATIDAPIGRNLTDRTKMSILQTSVSRDAKTTYRIVDQSDEVALVECDLHTGRTHQIRVHLRSIGHPILGDATYELSQSKDLTGQYEIKGMCLHSWKLSFESLGSKQIDVEAALPENFSSSLSAINLTAV